MTKELFSTGENEKRSEIIQEVADKTKEIIGGLPEAHGWEHTALVAELAKVLAVGEGQDPFNAEIAAWIHDWGRAKEKSDKIKGDHAVLSGIVSKDYFRRLYEERKITALQYGDIQRAIRRHSRAGATGLKTLKIIRDADKLSRFGPVGVYQLVLFSKENNLPFYAKGETVLRADNDPPLTRNEIRSNISNLNFALDFTKMLETGSGKIIGEALKEANQDFLELFSRHSDLVDYDFWLEFLKKNADDFRKKWEENKADFKPAGEEGGVNGWLNIYKKSYYPPVFSEENFIDFSNHRGVDQI